MPTLKKAAELVRLSPQRRFQALLLSLALVIGGQIIIHRTIPIESWEGMRQTINDWLRIDVNSLGNVIIGMGCSILGGLIFAVTTYQSELFQTKLSTFFPVPEGPILKKIHLFKWLLPFLVGMAFFAVLVLRAWKYELEFFDIFFWAGAILFLISAVRRYDRANGTGLALQVNYQELAIIVLLVTAGLLIGTYQLQDIPNVIKGDEGNFFENARFISNGEYRESIFGFGVYSYPIFSSFIQGEIMRVFGRDIWGWRFSSLVPALLSVIPLYLLGRDFFNRRVGIISSLIFLSSPYFLAFARLGYNNSQAILFVILAVWLLYQGLKRGSLLYLLFSGMACGLGFLTYTAGRLGLVIILVLFLVLTISRLLKRSPRRFLVIGLLVLLIGCTVIALPHLVYGANQSPQSLRYKLIEGLFINLDYVNGLFGEEDVYQASTITYLDNYRLIYNPELYQRLLLRGLIRTMLGFQLDEFATNFFLVSPLAGPGAVVFYVLGLYAFVSHFWKPTSYPVLIWFGAGMGLLSILSTYPPRPAHMVPIIPTLALFAGVGLVLAVEEFSTYLAERKPSWPALQPLLYGAVCLGIMAAGTRAYFHESPKVYRPNLEQVMNWAGLHNSPDTEIYYVYDSDYYQEWVPYFFRLGLTDLEFGSALYTDVLHGAAPWAGSSQYAIFYEETLVGDLLPYFKDQLDSADYITFRDQDERPIGRAVVMGDVQLSTAASFWVGLGRTLTSRVMWLAVPLLSLGIFLLFKANPGWSLGSLGPALLGSWKGTRLAAAIPAQPEDFDAGELDRTIQVGFFIRLSKRLYQAKIVLGAQRNGPASPRDPGPQED